MNKILWKKGNIKSYLTKTQLVKTLVIKKYSKEHVIENMLRLTNKYLETYPSVDPMKLHYTIEENNNQLYLVIGKFFKKKKYLLAV